MSSFSETIDSFVWLKVKTENNVSQMLVENNRHFLRQPQAQAEAQHPA